MPRASVSDASFASFHATQKARATLPVLLNTRDVHGAPCVCSALLCPDRTQVEAGLLNWPGYRFCGPFEMLITRVESSRVK